MTAQIVPFPSPAGVMPEREWCVSCGGVRPLTELRPVEGLLLCRPCRIEALGLVLVGEER